MLAETRMKRGWRKFRFDEVATNVNERVDNPSEAGVEYYVGLEHLDSDSLSILRWGEPTDVQATKLRFRKGDIIFGRRRVYQRKLGVAHFDGICSAHAMVLRAKPDVVLPEFLPFFMQSDLFMDRAKEISVGSLSPTINWPALAREEFLIPARDEQARIAALLSAIDCQTAAYGAVVDRADGVASSLLESFLGAAASPDASGAVRPSSSSRWPSASLGAVCEIRSGKINSSHAVPNGRYPFFTCAPDPSRIDRYTFDTEALLLSGNNAHGVYTVQYYKGKFEARQRVYVITLKDTRPLGYQYLLLVLSRSLGLMRALSVGSTSKHLTLGDLQSIPIPLPPLEAQAELTQTTANLTSVRESAMRRIVALRDLRRSVLSGTFNGLGT